MARGGNVGPHSRASGTTPATCTASSPTTSVSKPAKHPEVLIGTKIGLAIDPARKLIRRMEGVTINGELVSSMNLYLASLIGLALTAASALIVGLITLRMSGHYLPLATIAWGLSLYYLMGNLDALGKYDGILGVPPLKLMQWDIGQGRPFFVFAWTLVLLSSPNATPPKPSWNQAVNEVNVIGVRMVGPATNDPRPTTRTTGASPRWRRWSITTTRRSRSG